MASRVPDLAYDYGLSVSALEPRSGGFESDCWVADGTWFVKVWRNSEPPVRLGLLDELNAAGLPVPAPVPTVAGDLYGARDLDLDHIEYALLARALRDMAARVFTETDRPGVDTWGFQRIARLERALAIFRPFCT